MSDTNPIKVIHVIENWLANDIKDVKNAAKEVDKRIAQLGSRHLIETTTSGYRVKSLSNYRIIRIFQYLCRRLHIGYRKPLISPELKMLIRMIKNNSSFGMFETTDSEKMEILFGSDCRRLYKLVINNFTDSDCKSFKYIMKSNPTLLEDLKEARNSNTMFLPKKIDSFLFMTDYIILKQKDCELTDIINKLKKEMETKTFNSKTEKKNFINIFSNYVKQTILNKQELKDYLHRPNYLSNESQFSSNGSFNAGPCSKLSLLHAKLFGNNKYKYYNSHLLEGLPQIFALQSIIDDLRTFRSECHTPEDKENIKNLIKNLEFALKFIDFAFNAAQEATANENKKQPLEEELVKRIKDLEINKGEVLIPGNSMDHGIMYVIRKVYDGKYTVSVVNTGGGASVVIQKNRILQSLLKKPRVKFKLSPLKLIWKILTSPISKKYSKDIVYQATEEQLTPEFFRELKLKQNTTSFMSEIYSYFERKLGRPIENLGSLRSLQRKGVCAIKSITVVCNELLGKSLYNEFKLHLSKRAKDELSRFDDGTYQDFEPIITTKIFGEVPKALQPHYYRARIKQLLTDADRVIEKRSNPYL